MKIIKTIKTGLAELPERELWYYGPKMFTCTEKLIIKHREYTFELYIYDHKGNGKKYVKIFDSNNKQVFENLTIILGYNWAAGYSVKFFNEFTPNSNCYFEFGASTDFELEAVLNKLVLMAEKWILRSKDVPSFQYLYAYIIFLFFQNKNENIRASQFSVTYNILRKMRNYISEELTDNVNSRRFSKDTIIYKVFDRFVNKHLDAFKSKSILFD